MFHAWDVYEMELVERVFSFKLRSLALGMPSKDWLLSILRSGLWSTAITKLSKPSTGLVQCISDGKCLSLHRYIHN